MMRAARLGLGGGVLLLALAGCSHDTGDLDAPESPVISYDWSEQFSFDALAFGKLTLVDGCLVTTTDGTADNIGLIAFPRKYSSWDADTQTLTYGGKHYSLGDEISAGGGGVSHPEHLTMPPACQALVDERVNVFLIMDTSIDPADHGPVPTG